jgi:hypothetical protein
MKQPEAEPSRRMDGLETVPGAWRRRDRMWSKILINNAESIHRREAQGVGWS